MRLKTPLWGHQHAMIDRVIQSDRGYAYWVAGCGTGKTLAAYGLMQRLNAGKMLVITIKNAIYTAWGDDARQHLEGVNVLCLHPDLGSVEKRSQLMQQAVRTSTLPLVVVVNYEAAHKMPIDKMGFDIIICDESQEIKSHNGKISKSIANKSVRIPVRIAMTGTPWDDRPTDVYGQVRFLNAGTFGDWDDFFDRYTVWRRLPDHPSVKFVVGYRNQDDLAKMLKPFTIRIRREDVLSYLPPHHMIVKHIKMSPATKAIYQQMQNDFIATFDGQEMTAENIMVQRLRLHQVTCGFFQPYDEGSEVLRIPGSDEKLDMAMSLLYEMGSEPCVIFTHFREDVKKIAEELTKANIDYRVVTGDLAQHVEWQDGAGRVLIANISAGGIGTKFTRASYAIYYSLGDSNTDFEQSTFRLHRAGMSDRPVTSYILITEKSVDQDIYNNLRTKSKYSNYLNKEVGYYDKNNYSA